MVSKKKQAKGKLASRVVKRAKPGPISTLFYGDEKDFPSNGKHYEKPHYKNPETAEEREKRLAKREALTLQALQAFQIAHDNHHERKSS